MSEPILGPDLGDDAHGPDPTDVVAALGEFRGKVTEANRKADAAQAAVDSMKADLAAIREAWSEFGPVLKSWATGQIGIGELAAAAGKLADTAEDAVDESTDG